MDLYNKEDKEPNSDKKKSRITFVNIFVMALVVILVLALIPLFIDKWEQMLMQGKLGRVQAGNDIGNFALMRGILSYLIYIVIFMIGYKMIVSYKKRREEEYDAKVIKKAVSEVISGAEFIRDQCIMPEALKGFGIIPFYDTYKKRGMIRYQRDGKNYTFSNIALYKIRENNHGRRTKEVIYKGQVYTAYYKTELPGTVRIFATKRIALIGKETEAGYPSKRKGETKIETENILFNDNFDVYASDEQSAFFVLNPIVMEQLLEMKRLYKEMGVYISKDRMVITLKTNQILFPEQPYIQQKEQEALEKSKRQAKDMLRMTELLEDSINGSITNNFTNQRKE